MGAATETPIPIWGLGQHTSNPREIPGDGQANLMCSNAPFFTELSNPPQGGQGLRGVGFWCPKRSKKLKTVGFGPPGQLHTKP